MPEVLTESGKQRTGKQFTFLIKKKLDQKENLIIGDKEGLIVFLMTVAPQKSWYMKSEGPF